MEVILLRTRPQARPDGRVVRVKDGYARNFLLPQGKALRATEANRSASRRQRAQLEARNLELKKEAEGVAGSSTARASSSSARPAKPASSTARSPRATSPT